MYLTDLVCYVVYRHQVAGDGFHCDNGVQVRPGVVFTGGTPARGVYGFKVLGKLTVLQIQCTSRCECRAKPLKTAQYHVVY